MIDVVADVILDDGLETRYESKSTCIQGSFVIHVDDAEFILLDNECQKAE